MGRHLRIDEEQQRVLRHHPDGREIAFGVVGQLRVRGGNHRKARCHHEQRIAVGRRLGGGFSADDAARRWAVVHDHRLPQRSLQIWRDQPRDDIVQSAGGERHDQSDWPIGVGVRRRAGDARQREHKDDKEQAAGPAATPLLHCT